MWPCEGSVPLSYILQETENKREDSFASPISTLIVGVVLRSPHPSDRALQGNWVPLSGGMCVWGGLVEVSR